jgi:hypothetical protein
MAFAWDAIAMRKDSEDGMQVSKRFQRLHFNPLRDVLPIVAVVAGAFIGIRAALQLSSGGNALFLYVGSGLIVIGVLMLIVNRWQAKRGL